MSSREGLTAMARATTAGDWGEPPQETRRRQLRSSCSTRGLLTSMVIMVAATLLQLTRSRSRSSNGWEGHRGQGNTHGEI